MGCMLCAFYTCILAENTSILHAKKHSLILTLSINCGHLDNKQKLVFLGECLCSYAWTGW